MHQKTKIPFCSGNRCSVLSISLHVSTWFARGSREGEMGEGNRLQGDGWKLNVGF